MAHRLLDHDEQREKEYVANEGTVCPICRGGVITYAAVNVEDGMGTCHCVCNKCEGNWTEVWHLVGITTIYKKVGVTEI